MTIPSSRRVTNSTKALYGALKGLGLSPASIKSVLPSWWDDSYADDPLGLTELKVLLARRLSIDPATLFSENLDVEFLPVVRRYKGGRQDLMERLQSSTAIANALCRTALSFVHKQGDYSRLKDPTALRKEILGSGACHVGLEELLDLCWGLGIPVLHICLPQGLKKFDALVISEEDRFAIALCRNEASPAWLAFHLAHEIGHVACGHLSNEGMLVDENIEADIVAIEQEKEANDYATRLLGSEDIAPPILNFKKRLSQTKSLVELGTKHQVSPGHLVLKAGSRDNNFACARVLLSDIEGKNNAREVISRRALNELRQMGINEEAEEFLGKFSFEQRA